MSGIITNPSFSSSVKTNHFPYQQRLPKEELKQNQSVATFENLKISKPNMEDIPIKAALSRQDILQDIHKTAYQLGVNDITDRDILVAMHQGGSLLVDYLI